MVDISKCDEDATNTKNFTSKHGRVLKKNFDDAQDVYQKWSEAKYE